MLKIDAIKLLEKLTKSSSLGLRGSLSFKAPKKGPRIAVIIMLHGDEPCGLGAFETFVKNPKILKRGEVCFILANIYAARLINTTPSRFLVLNMNRIPKDTISPTPEYKRFWYLKDKLSSFDLVIDLHSTSTPSPTMCIPNSAMPQELLHRLPVEVVIFGVYSVMKSLSLVEALNPVPALTIECGEHLSPNSWFYASDVVLTLLNEVGLAHKSYIPEIKVPSEKKLIKVTHSIWTKQPGFRMVKTFCNLEKVHEQQPLAQNDSGESILSPVNGLILFPFSEKKQLVTTEEICFIGKEIPYGLNNHKALQERFLNSCTL